MKTLSVSLVAMMLIAPMADAAGKDEKSFSQYSTDIIKKHDEACDCCMKCRVATRDVNGHQTANGCRDCCERCDKKLPTDKDKIPEIIKKKN